MRDEPAIHACVASFPAIDVLVNCAGVLRRGAELDPKVFGEVLDINLNGTMRTCAAACDKLRASGGCIVNTASMLSFFGGALVPGYSASKGGVAQLTKSLAIAYADDGIRVNAIAPGWIATRLTDALQADPARSDPIIARTPLERWGRPEDVAGPVLFLAPRRPLRNRRDPPRGRRLPGQLKELTDDFQLPDPAGNRVRRSRRTNAFGCRRPGRLVPAAAPEHGHRQLVQPAAGVQVRRVFAAHPPVVGVRPVLKGAWRTSSTTGWRGRQLRLRAAWRIHTLVVDEAVGARR